MGNRIMYFKDRADAGRELAQTLADLQGHSDLLVMGIPRGGVVVAYHVARALNARLDICLTHKLGAPGNPELAIGAVAEDGTMVRDEHLIRRLGISDEYVEAEAERQRRELARRAQLYRSNWPPASLAGRAVIVTDDGVATGATMMTSLQALAARQPALLIAAIPVAPDEAVARLKAVAHRVECVLTPDIFWSVGSFYADFDQVSDAQVIALLGEGRGRNDSTLAQQQA